ncbi:hypothetical protein BJV77DRAFT_199698 [Russula vinacea]|nr:hypothetical protein BJV77DRAFT_199698 [Russula vinacea]
MDGRPRERRTSKSSFHTTRKPTIPMSLVNRFMRVLSVTNPSSALQLWEHMGVLYATTPDALSFTTMLDAARQATLNGDSFAGAMQELGFDLRFRYRSLNPIGRWDRDLRWSRLPLRTQGHSTTHVAEVTRSSKDHSLSTRAICGWRACMASRTQDLYQRTTSRVACTCRRASTCACHTLIRRKSRYFSTS